MSEQEFWGCEYLDHGRMDSLPLKSGPPRPQIYNISMELLSSIVDNRYLTEIGIRDKEQISQLVISISSYGILTPGKLIYDHVSVRLQDGNHRYLAARNLGLPFFPVTLHRTERLRGAGGSLGNIFEFLLNNNN